MKIGNGLVRVLYKKFIIENKRISQYSSPVFYSTYKKGNYKVELIQDYELRSFIKEYRSKIIGD